MAILKKTIKQLESALDQAEKAQSKLKEVRKLYKAVEATLSRLDTRDYEGFLNYDHIWHELADADQAHRDGYTQIRELEETTSNLIFAVNDIHGLLDEQYERNLDKDTF